jgi:hypothetical protein
MRLCELDFDDRVKHTQSGHWLKQEKGYQMLCQAVIGQNRTFAVTKLIDALSGPTQSEVVRLGNMEQEL